MSSINFDNIYLLFIALPLLAAAIVPFVIAINKDNRSAHNVASFVLHIVMAVVISFSAAGTKIVTVMTRTEVYVLADVSYSAEKNLTSIDSYVAQIKSTLPPRSKLGVISFGKNYEVTTKLGQKLNSVNSAGVDGSETNIVQALKYAGSQFSANAVKHVVIITDARQSYAGDDEELKRTVTEMQMQNVHIDALFLNDTLPDEVAEVQITSAKFTKNAYLNRTEQVTLQIDSSVNTAPGEYGTARITLTKNGEEESKILSQPLYKGANSVTFKLDTSSAGEYDYTATVSADWDENSKNNSYSFTQLVHSELNVLALTSSADDAAYLQKLYGDEYGENAVLDCRIITDEHASVPNTVEALCRYDEIVLSDIDVSLIPNYEYLLANMDIAVGQFGKSLLTFGSVGIQNKPTGELRQLDNMLPLRYGQAEGDKKLYTIVMDVSHSMQIWSRAILAKQAAKELIKFLRDEDSVCIVSFSGTSETIVPITSLVNRQKVIDAIDSMQFKQGTMTGAALHSANLKMRNRSDFNHKECMVISDGIPFAGTYDNGMDDKEYSYSEVQDMRAHGIYTSVLQVGGGNEEHLEWMNTLANYGGGNYYTASNETELGSVMFGNIQEDVSEPVVKDDSFITEKMSSDSVVMGNDAEGTVAINFKSKYVSQFVKSTKKSNGVNNVLMVSYRVNSTYTDVPLYAYWNYQNGKVKSYAGQLGEINAVGSSSAAQINGDFFGNIIKTAVPDEKTSQPYSLNAQFDGKTAIVQIRIPKGNLHASATASARITSPDGSVYTAPLIRGKDDTGSTVYYCEFAARSTGKYQAAVTYSYNGGDYDSFASFNLSYEPEYNEFAEYDSTVLYRALGGKGTVLEQDLISAQGMLKIEHDGNEVETFVLQLQAPLLIAAVVLFVIDVIVRKVKWNDITTLFRKLFRRKQKGGGK